MSQSDKIPINCIWWRNSDGPCDVITVLRWSFVRFCLGQWTLKLFPQHFFSKLFALPNTCSRWRTVNQKLLLADESLAIRIVLDRSLLSRNQNEQQQNTCNSKIHCLFEYRSFFLALNNIYMCSYIVFAIKFEDFRFVIRVDLIADWHLFMTAVYEFYQSARNSKFSEKNTYTPKLFTLVPKHGKLRCLYSLYYNTRQGRNQHSHFLRASPNYSQTPWNNTLFTGTSSTKT